MDSFRNRRNGLSRWSLALAALLCPAWGGVAQAQKFPAPSTDCTEAGSKAASWDIRNFTFDTDSRFNFGPGTAGTVSFSIKNSANGYQFDCLQGDTQKKRSPNHSVVDGKVYYSCNVFCYGASRDPWEENPPLNTSFHFDTGSKELNIQQQWTCGGGINNTTTTFAGSGSAILSNITCQQVPDGRPDQVTCSPVNATVKASNVSVAVPVVDNPDDVPDYRYTPPTSARPASRPQVLHNTAGCRKASESPSWTITGFFHSDLGVRFGLTNNVLNYTTRCSVNDLTLGAGQRFNKETALAPNEYWTNCSRYDNAHATYPYDGIYTEILYGGTQNLLAINQTWYCDDEEGSSPTVFSGYAETKLRIDCLESRICQPADEFHDEPVLSILDRCSSKEVTLAPTKLNSFQVSKEKAAKSFSPHGYNCTDRSLGAQGKPAWELANFSFNRTWNPNWVVPGFMDEAQFNYNNTATDSEWPMNVGGEHTCYGQSPMSGPSLDGTQRFYCFNFNYQTYAPEFAFNFNTSTLTLDQEWSCDATDRDHVNTFDAKGTTTLKLTCKSVGNGTYCTGAPGKILTPMTNLTATLNVVPDRSS